MGFGDRRRRGVPGERGFRVSVVQNYQCQAFAYIRFARDGSPRRLFMGGLPVPLHCLHRDDAWTEIRQAAAYAFRRDAAQPGPSPLARAGFVAIRTVSGDGFLLVLSR